MYNTAGISDTFPGLTNIMDSVYTGGLGGGELKAGSFIHLNRKAAIVFIEVHREPQFTCQASTVAESSLTPSVVLLMRPRGTTHSKVDCHEFTGLPVKADLAICSYVYHCCVWIVQEHGFHVKP